LDVIVENFSVGEKHLGQLELLANHQEQNWRIEKLHLVTADSSLSIKGLWDRPEKREDASRIQATLFLESNDIGKFLTRLGLPERIKRGRGRLEGSFSWNGVPQSIDYATLTGSFRITARNGQFPKFEPGIGRLFGIFDLRALPRRIILDFHDIFSEGFGFNEILADIKVNRGIAATNDLVIEGPAARIMMTGRINLEEESQDLHMKVVPSLGLATPVVGVASLIVSKALQKPASPNEYHITGEWTDPLVTKIAGRAARLDERD
ncbi:MAG TPA: AsmA-like C-terminal region-containing protein, partial [Nitrosospira sp.]|nr:AsmA-like C-terminal region-containing protein [Nitrosospira sp.]